MFNFFKRTPDVVVYGDGLYARDRALEAKTGEQFLVTLMGLLAATARRRRPQGLEYTATMGPTLSFREQNRFRGDKDEDTVPIPDMSNSAGWFAINHSSFGC